MRASDPRVRWTGDVLIAPGITLRPETAEDEAFLRQLFIANRRGEFAPLGMAETALVALLDTQFDLQRSHFRAAFRDADWSIVMRKGAAVGRLYVAKSMAARVLVDISLMPEISGQGIGGVLIDHILREAQAARRAMTLHVRPHNPARRLYARKGFAETGLEGADMTMRWSPGG